MFGIDFNDYINQGVKAIVELKKVRETDFDDKNSDLYEFKEKYDFTSFYNIYHSNYSFRLSIYMNYVYSIDIDKDTITKLSSYLRKGKKFDRLYENSFRNEIIIFNVFYIFVNKLDTKMETNMYILYDAERKKKVEGVRKAMKTMVNF